MDPKHQVCKLHDRMKSQNLMLRSCMCLVQEMQKTQARDRCNKGSVDRMIDRVPMVSHRLKS